MILELNFFNLCVGGIIQYSQTYSNIFTYYVYSNEMNISFCFQYKNSWYPLIKNKGELNIYKEINFENWEDIKRQVHENFKVFVNKIKQIEQAYDEISKLYEFNWHIKPDRFYQNCEKIINKNIIQNFKNKIYEFKQFSEGEEITFEGLCYHIIYNTNNIFDNLYHSFPDNIKSILKKYFENYKNLQIR